MLLARVCILLFNFIGTNSPPTPNSLEGFNSTPVIIGVVIAVVAIAVASVVCYIRFKK